MMLLQFCLVLALGGASSASGCRWISHKFGELHGQYLTLLREMGAGLSAGGEEACIFDSEWHKWFLHHRHSQPQKQVWLVIETLEQISALLNEADPVSWSEDQLGDFLSTLERQTEGLRSCMSVRMRRSKRLPLYFNQLKVLAQSATDQVSAWEQIRRELLKVLSLLESLPALSAI
ncbi:interferon phi 4 [Salminus brasiliensis]|uniref:interferon phi 4 n=1 Tax=Salminus brasiliensis TaxID=930266 RepID=UPI003B837C86